MNTINYSELISWLIGKQIERPNINSGGTLSGHAAGEPFEKLVYQYLKSVYPGNIFKQYEFLNDLFRKNPISITLSDRMNLINSPTALFLLSRGKAATKDWNPTNIFEEKQNDTADILFHSGTEFQLLDIKTRNISKKAQAPNIISAYKLAQMCALMIDNEEYDTISINYVEIDWVADNEILICKNAHFASLFNLHPEELYINWAAAMQIQFHVCELEQSYSGSRQEWARDYLRVFVLSAERRCEVMYQKYVVPFKKYISSL